MIQRLAQSRFVIWRGYLWYFSYCVSSFLDWHEWYVKSSIISKRNKRKNSDNVASAVCKWRGPMGTSRNCFFFEQRISKINFNQSLIMLLLILLFTQLLAEAYEMRSFISNFGPPVSTLYDVTPSQLRPTKKYTALELVNRNYLKTAKGSVVILMPSRYCVHVVFNVSK